MEKTNDEREAFEAWYRTDSAWKGLPEHRWEELFSLLDVDDQKADIICGSAKRDWKVWQARASRSEPVNAGALKLLDSIITDMEGGFVKCENCGEQEDTATLDFMPQLRELRAALTAPPPASTNRLTDVRIVECMDEADKAIKGQVFDTPGARDIAWIRAIIAATEGKC